MFRLGRWTGQYSTKMFQLMPYKKESYLYIYNWGHATSGPDWAGANDSATIQPLKLLFTDQTKVITAAGGQNSVTQMIGTVFGLLFTSLCLGCSVIQVGLLLLLTNFVFKRLTN